MKNIKVPEKLFIALVSEMMMAIVEWETAPRLFISELKLLL